MIEHVTQPGWVAVEEYLSAVVVHPDPAHQRALHSAVEAGMPPIEVAPNAGKLLRMLVQMSGARRILEIGTLAGFSTIWMAQGLPEDGRLVTCEYLPKHAQVARANVDAAGVGHKVEIRVGAALDSLPTLVEYVARQGAFDFVFIDADKENDSNYLDWAIRLGRPGTVIVMDNVIWDGAILEPERDMINAPGIVSALEMMGKDPRLDATAIQTVGAKGWDGFALARVLGP
ncbi:O-methyltransferase [Arthrobacter sp. CJ23]|uniref:O-methyltransferase n=1 Tax=Arthrobacter sp. CJ23 TaxID=2972479 RepID=UPI00215D541A|nr:O-methyltransferase [Arthrobacter sp. CJ23]UVJ39929.1 O-methyltransferase [Arthrobacter sp. CJ23]